MEEDAAMKLGTIGIYKVVKESTGSTDTAAALLTVGVDLTIGLRAIAVQLEYVGNQLKGLTEALAKKG